MGDVWPAAVRVPRHGWLVPALLGLYSTTASAAGTSETAPADQPTPAAAAVSGTDPAPTTRLSDIHVEGWLVDSATQPVDGYAAERNRSATKTDTPLIKVPQAVTVITADQIAAQNATNLSDVMGYVSGSVPALRGSGQNRYDLFNLRGFRPDQYLDGLRLGSYFYTTSRVDPFLLERIDILKGPASVLYGQTPPGGVVNSVSKRPSANVVNQVFVQGGNDARLRGGFDIGGNVDTKGDVRYRIVAVGEREDGAQATPDSSNFSIAPSITFHISEATELTILAKYRNDPEVGSAGALPYVGTVDPRADGSRLKRGFYVGDAGFDNFYRRDRQIGTEFSHRFNEHVAFRQHLRYDHNEVQYRSVYASGYSPDRAGLLRASTVSDESMDDFAIDNQLLITFDTGALDHTVLAGIDYQDVDGNRATGYGSAAGLSLADPNYHQTIAEPALTDYAFDQDQLGYYLQDQIALGRLILIGGGRYDHIQTAQTTRQPGLHETRSDHAVTVRAGALYAFDFGLSPYVSYTESFQPPSTDGVSANVLEPTEGHQYELGVKYQPREVDALFTASVFKIRQKNVSGDTRPDGTVTQTGEVEVNGAEIEAKASLAAGLDLTAAGTYLDSEITRSDLGYAGNALSQTPKYSGSLWLDYTQPSGRWAGFGGGLGLRYVGSQQVGNANTAEVPDYTLFDGALHYSLGQMSQRLAGWKVALNVHNLFNKKYVASCLSEAFCYYGEERKTSATVSYHWQ
ncbi:TonB-dependent siderophore receptor [Salinisphaera sp. SPP-AMP-43]|uniref:TonB-dependent siderophore receptor n=1 Tax=Salinisphaera sp. SPP-AMP-43 TaxID=3121288 RepID=UPI003C6E1674